jgi:hypothetical protein
MGNDGEHVDVATVPYSAYYPYSNDAEQLVKERFNLAEAVALDQIAAAQVYLASLTSLFTNADMPDTDITYDFQNLEIDSGLVGNRPDAPSTTELTPGTVSVPEKGILTSISVPTISIPSYTLAEPSTTELYYDEAVYQSDLHDALEEALLAFIENGGTGLGSDVEDALWARARARQALTNEKVRDTIEEFMSARGYTVPPGALSGLLKEALLEETRGDAQMNYEISIEQARLARAQSEFTVSASITMEGQAKEQFNNIANRALEYAKASAQVIIDLYLGKVQGYIAKQQALKLTVEAAKLQVDAAAAANESVNQSYAIDVQAYEAQIKMEIAIVESIAKVYGFKIAGYEADAKVAAIQLNGQIEELRAKMDQANNQTNLTLKEAELTIQSYLGALQLTADGIKAGGNISAQIAASALSAVNASASLGASEANNQNTGRSYTANVSNTATLSESHKYDHTEE